MDRIEVVSPAGGESADRKSIAPRLRDLNGKTVAEIWNGVFKGDETFPVIRQALRERYPGIRYVPGAVNRWYDTNFRRPRRRWRLRVAARRTGCRFP